MKKTIFLGIAAVFTLAIFSCGNFAVPEAAEKVSNVVGYTEDGRAIVELSFGTGTNSRALHRLLSEAVADFYEVVFYDPVGPDVYRISWREGSVAKLRVPSGVNYSNSAGNGYAYIFAGRESDYTLLGVGTIDDVYEGATPTIGTTITANATRVDFEIVALETNVSDDSSTLSPGPLGTGVSTFRTTPFAPIVYKVNDVDIPIFAIDETTPTPATFEVTIGGNTSAERALLDCIIRATGSLQGYSKAFLVEGSIPITSLLTVTFPGISAIDAPLVFPFPIELTPDPVYGAGLCTFYFEIPVYLYNDDTPTYGSEAVTWMFKGGLNNSILDMGYENRSAGGAILLSVGDALDGGPGSLIISGK
ncbi:MAG: hypothetical protein FWH41_07380 [Treponema sp.]|nr:hypothetical protein [Treponema sp.]